MLVILADIFILVSYIRISTIYCIRINVVETSKPLVSIVYVTVLTLPHDYMFHKILYSHPIIRFLTFWNAGKCRGLLKGSGN